METKTEEIKRVEIRRTYIANDGTEFTSEDECVAYENTAHCAIMAQYNKLILKTMDEYKVFDMGSSDNIVEIVKLNTPDDVRITIEALLATTGHHTNEPIPNWIQRRVDTIEKAYREDDLLLVWRSYDMTCFETYTRNSFIERLQNLCKEELLKNIGKYKSPEENN